MIELNETYSGKCSWFGGSNDTGVSVTEGLALYNDIEDNPNLFIFKYGKALARSLNPKTYYCACRWDYDITPKDLLRKCLLQISFKDKKVICSPVDWGPAESTNRIVDMSFGAMTALGCQTEDVVQIMLFQPHDFL